MGRRRRIDYPGAWHHVMNRGARRTATFLDDEDRRAFLRLLAGARQVADTELHGYCLMSNHYHLLARSPSGDLATFMQFIGKNYTQWFNRRHGHDGPLFRGRYHCELVDSDAYVLAASRYIHRNPIEVAPHQRPLAHHWSSLRAYLGVCPAPPWLTTGFVLDLAGGRSAYKNYVLRAHNEAA